jgi:hypothetical protein
VRPKSSRSKERLLEAVKAPAKKEWTNKDCPRKGKNLPSGQRSCDAQLSKEKELHVGNAGKPVADQGQCPGGPLKLHLNRGLASIVQR